MINVAGIIVWFQYRKLKKNRKLVQQTLLDLSYLTVTIHGRLMLEQVCLDPDNSLPYEIKRMYWVLLKDAPIKEWAQWN